MITHSRATLDHYKVRRVQDEKTGKYSNVYYPCCKIWSLNNKLIDSRYPFRTIPDDDETNDIKYTYGDEIIVEYNDADPSSFTIVEEYDMKKSVIWSVIIIAAILIFWLLVRSFGMEGPIPIQTI